MCFRIVIEDKVEDSKFAQEKHVFSMYLDNSSIEVEANCLLDNSSIDRDFILNRSSIAA